MVSVVAFSKPLPSEQLRRRTSYYWLWAQLTVPGILLSQHKRQVADFVAPAADAQISVPYLKVSSLVPARLLTWVPPVAGTLGIDAAALAQRQQ